MPSRLSAGTSASSLLTRYLWSPAVDQLLAEEELSERVEAAIQKLLNVVEALSADKKSLADEVERLRKQLEQKKKAKTTKNSDKDNQADNQDSDSDHSSEKRRRKL